MHYNYFIKSKKIKLFTKIKNFPLKNFQIKNFKPNKKY